MDPNTVVLEISSDEEGDWNDHGGRGIADASDDDNWLAELLVEVSKANYGGDSDELVVVNEVSKKTEKKSELKSSLVDLDDDCVILDNDPDKPVEVRNDNLTTGNDDSDDLLVVSEKGQVACRDYPHPRHLCIKYPFSATPNQDHCNQCYCYVCDSLAPCVYWGNGSASTDHCHATDKDDSWRLKRKNSKISDTSQPHPMDPVRPALALVQVPRPGLTRAHYTPANFGVPNITNQTRNPVFASRNKFNPGLVSQLLLRTNESRAQGHGDHNYNLGNQLHRPVFKRPGSAGVAPTVNRYRSYWGNFGNSSRQQNHTSSTVNPLPFQPQFSNHSNPNFESRINSNPYPENPTRYQPNLVPSSSPPEAVPSRASYPVPSQTRVDSPSIPVSDNIIDPNSKDYDISWPLIDTTHQSVIPVKDSSSLVGDYQYDSWMFDNEPVEPGLMDVPGGYYDSGFIDTGPIIEF